MEAAGFCLPFNSGGIALVGVEIDPSAVSVDTPEVCISNAKGLMGNARQFFVVVVF